MAFLGFYSKNDLEKFAALAGVNVGEVVARAKAQADGMVNQSQSLLKVTGEKEQQADYVYQNAVSAAGKVREAVYVLTGPDREKAKALLAQAKELSSTAAKFS